jgi:hypothetical protein
MLEPGLMKLITVDGSVITSYIFSAIERPERAEEKTREGCISYDKRAAAGC